MRSQPIWTLRKANTLRAVAIITVATGATSKAHADEGGVSFWLPGQYGSFAAIAPADGWSMPMQAYTYQGSAGKTDTLPRGDRLTAAPPSTASDPPDATEKPSWKVISPSARRVTSPELSMVYGPTSIDPQLS